MDGDDAAAAAECRRDIVCFFSQCANVGGEQEEEETPAKTNRLARQMLTLFNAVVF